MSKRLSGTLLGFLAGIGGVGLYVVLYAFVGLIPGIAMFIIAFGFFGVYTKLNPTDKSWYSVIIASVLTVIGAVAGMFGGIAIIAGQEGFPLNELFQYQEIKDAFLYDLIFTLVFAVVAIALVVFTKIKAQKTDKTALGAAGAQGGQPEITGSGNEESHVVSTDASAEAAKEKPANRD